MARKKLIAGNWKMNTTKDEAANLVKSIIENTAGVSDVDIMVAPPFINIAPVAEAAKTSNVKVGAQNMYIEDSGAFTGEISPSMLKAFGVAYVILGHSERRAIFGESDELINEKVKKALSESITPVFCVGETLEEREGGKAEEIVGTQVTKGLKDVSADDMKSVVIAYEPVWAIGTGKTATPEDADAMHAHIRKVITDLYSASVSEETIILYGGSMKDSNCDELLNMPNIDGGLIGGAALKAESFTRIIKYTKK